MTRSSGNDEKAGRAPHGSGRPKPDPSDTPHVLAPPPLIYLIPLLAGLGFGWWRRWAPLAGPWPHLIGPPFLLVGMLLLLPSLRAFREARTNPKPWKPSTALVIAGPYRFTRNPMYLGFTCTYVGIAAWMNSAWPFLLLPGVIAVMQRFVIRREERYLERKFGEPYRAYMQSVRRWI